MTVKEADQLCFAIAEESPRVSAYTSVNAAIDNGNGRGVTVDIDSRDLTADQLRRIAAVLDQVTE